MAPSAPFCWTSHGGSARMVLYFLVVMILVLLSIVGDRYLRLVGLQMRTRVSVVQSSYTRDARDQYPVNGTVGCLDNSPVARPVNPCVRRMDAIHHSEHGLYRRN